MIIAVDGPVAAGKGTLARRIAEKYGFQYLDTGALYRAVGLSLLQKNQDPTVEDLAIIAAKNVADISLVDPELRLEHVGNAASIVAANQGVRAALLDYQRDVAKHSPGAVLDGRDIGTVVCPEAEVKLFVTASAEVRAKRRFDELAAKGESVTLDQVLSDLKERDARDQGRISAPLAKAEDAHLLDTTKLDIETALDVAYEIIEKHLPT